ncbi:MAG: hypothetical protein ACM3RX_06020 [Methanococcaceae archaeon]
MKNKRLILPAILSGLMMFSAGSCTKDDGNTDTGTGWSALGNLDLANVYDMYVDKTGNLFVAGAFKNAAGNHYVAKWDGTKWSEVGTLNINDNILAICGDANGNLYIGGLFTNTAGQEYVAKWNGSTWTNIGYTAEGSDMILSLRTDAAGNLYGGSDTKVSKWNGSTWTKLNMTGYNHWVNTLFIDASGNLYTGGGSFTAGTGGCVAKWNGNGWTEIGSLNTYEQAYSICTDASGSLYAAGGFTSQSGYVVKWNGSSWTNLALNGNGRVNSICTDSKGNLYAGGSFYNSKNKFYVAKWNGTTWTDLGLDAYSGINKLIHSNGKLYVGGFLAFILNSGHYVAVSNQ